MVCVACLLSAISWRCLCMFRSAGVLMSLIFFFKQKTAYEMRISDWSSDVCSSDLDQAIEIYTSGSMALPKGVKHNHGPLLARAHFLRGMLNQIGRASCRERVCKYV